MTITIYHNPKCGTCRNTLAIIRQSGVEPQIIEYLKTPLQRDKMAELVAKLDMPVRDLMRDKEEIFLELGLGDDKWSDAELIDFIVAHPILMNRPVVVTAKGAKLCRPSETVLDILPNPDIGPFTNSFGQVVIDKDGKRVL